MRKSRFTEEQIALALRQVDAGVPVADQVLRNKVLKPAALRERARWLIGTFHVSTQRACRLLRLNRSTYYKPSTAKDQTPLRTRLRELAAARPRFGYPRLHILLRREGWKFAHWVLPRTFIDEQWTNLDPEDMSGADPPPLPAGPGPDVSAMLGYDVVCWEHQDFGCSPLSCNLMAQDFKVNRFCLVPNLEEALRLVAAFTKEQCEPGPYLAVRVARVPR